MGKLSFEGSIDINQFWPIGESDADTAHVVLDGPIQFTDDAGKTIETHAFDGASVAGKNVIRNNRFTIRLQAIDAPEIHYMPQSSGVGKLTAEQKARFNQYEKEYRQPLGETATVNLYNVLKSTGKNPVPCTVTTIVEKPNEVFDAYGRLIGNINTVIGGKETDVNLYMLERGLVFPTFYSSMSEDELKIYMKAAAISREDKSGLWAYYKQAVGTLDLSLVFRAPGTHPTFSPSDDTGDVIMPKIFRRLCNYTALHKAQAFSGTYKHYLSLIKDQCFLADEFLEQGVTASKIHTLDEFVNDAEVFTLWPDQLIFQEASSVLMKDGTKVTDW